MDLHRSDLWPDDALKSCYAAWNYSDSLPSVVERDGRWHHLAVTWTAAGNGLSKIYVDGLLRVQTATGKTAPLRPGGALMLGAEQDCYAGCTDRGQGFYGQMDEVRIWRVERSQADILANMRDGSALDRHPDLAAYWRFNDPEEAGLYRGAVIARDASGRGNDLKLMTLPSTTPAHISTASKSAQTGTLETSALTFRNNYAMNQGFQGMPFGDITIEFWARTPSYNASHPDVWSEFINFATSATSDTGAMVFIDDALLIEKYTQEFRGTDALEWQDISTAGSISVHVNANREGMGSSNDHWIDFAVGWVDDVWHHVAVSWVQSSGEVALYFDGQPQTPFWVSTAGSIDVKDPTRGGVSRRIAAGTHRGGVGSLVVGNKQESFGGGFSSQFALHGDMAALRIWERALTQSDVIAGMFTVDPPNKSGIVFSYDFSPANLHIDKSSSDGSVKDTYSSLGNDLYLGANAPGWVYSTAPLADNTGKPLPPPTPGSAGHAMYLSDQQVLIHKGFKDFPADELTLEFWMMSWDSCREGVPFSYATGGAGDTAYGKSDNSFLVFNYKDWGVSVMEDEGHISDHTAGLGANDGRWTHVAVSWRSSDGETKLYQNGRLVWKVVRGRGSRIPSGGTLVIGREQDCEGGCFDSDWGSAGDVQSDWKQEYGPQDFFGLIDEMRLWRKVRSVDDIAVSIRSRLGTKGRTGERGGSSTSPDINPSHPDLVAYWTFDEGRGYVVKDVTGRGHDLVATQPPNWEVVRYLAVCGNGILEGLEECDDGDLTDGDGCSAECKIESGWECSKTSPSKCWVAGERPPPVPGPAPAPGPGPQPQPSGGGGGTEGGPGSEPARKKGMHPVVITFFVFGIIGAVIAAVVSQRHALYDRFPIVEDAVAGASEKMKGLMERVQTAIAGRAGGGHAYSYAGDLDEDLHAADFTSSLPPPGRGPYAPLP